MPFVLFLAPVRRYKHLMKGFRGNKGLFLHALYFLHQTNPLPTGGENEQTEALSQTHIALAQA